LYGDILVEPGLAVENLRKAYELRDRVSERERFGITSGYHEVVTGDLEKASQTNELWAQTYPRDSAPHNALATIHEYLGQYERLAAEELEAIRLFPGNGIHYSNLMEAYISLDRL